VGDLSGWAGPGNALDFLDEVLVAARTGNKTASMA
jgi:hypothetical protein